MKLNEFLDAASYHIISGSEFLWDCYPSSRYLNISNIDDIDVGACIFNIHSLEVYEVEVYVNEDEVAYRWISPGYEVSAFAETEKLGLDPNIAYDNVKFTDVRNEYEILALVEKVVHKTYVHSHMLEINSTK